MGSYTADEALKALSAMTDGSKAASHVDASAKLFMAGRYEEAKAELEKAIKLNPMNATAHGNMGHLLMRQGKSHEAIPWLEKAIELNPTLEGAPQALSEARASAQPKKSGCFIATVCCESPDAPAVCVLRRFRDQCLTRSACGRFLVWCYIHVSPPVADWIGRRPSLRRAVRRRIIEPLARSIEPHLED